jgi:hypothetical protein
MSFKKTVARSAIVGALGFSALGLGVGLGTASADHGNGGQRYAAGPAVAADLNGGL